MKVIIVGGVAGGASCAARLRRLDEQAEIVMVERGPYVSFANCGLPYHVGGVIEHESDLLVANEQLFREQFAVDCRTGCEAIGISPEDKTVQLRDVATGEVTHRVLRQARALARGGFDPPAAARHRPARHLPGAGPCPTRGRSASGSSAARASSPGWRSTRASRRCARRCARSWSAAGSSASRWPRTSSVRGFEVTVVEMADQVLAPLDREYGRLVERLPRAPRRARRARRRRRRIRAVPRTRRSPCRRSPASAIRPTS